MLEPYKLGEVEPYSKSGRRYPEVYEGLGGCHLRALFNVSISAAIEMKKKGVNHTNTEGVLGILNKMKEANGNVFHLEKKHWVALEKGAEERIQCITTTGW